MLLLDRDYNTIEYKINWQSNYQKTISKCIQFNCLNYVYILQEFCVIYN